MKFNELLNSLDPENFISFLETNEELTEKGKEIFFKKFLELRNMTPEISDDPLEILILNHPGFSTDNDLVIEGIRRKKNLDKIPEDYKELEEYIERYSFSFNKWGQVLNYKINDKSLKEIDNNLIVFLIIDEIIEFGLDEESISIRLEEIEKLLSEAESSIENGEYIELEDNRTEEEKEEAYQKTKKVVNDLMHLYYEYLKLN